MRRPSGNSYLFDWYTHRLYLRYMDNLRINTFLNEDIGHEILGPVDRDGGKHAFDIKRNQTRIGQEVSSAVC